MADDPLYAVPTMAQVLGAAPTAAPTAPGAVPPDTGTGFVGSALGAGYHDVLAGTAGFAQALGQAGLDKVLPGFSDAQAAAVQAERAKAAGYANPAYSGGGWDPASLAYGVLRGLPSFAPMIAGAAAAPELLGLKGAAEGAGMLARMTAPRALGAIGGGAIGAYPGAVGENIERATDEGQPVDQTAAQKALALGVPEAVMQGALPGGIEETLAGGVAQGLAKRGMLARAAVGGGVMAGFQATQGAATEALMQQMGDPNRDLASRAQGVLDAALGGGVQGLFLGGLTHAFAKTPPPRISNENLDNITRGPLGLPPPDNVNAPQLPPPHQMGPGEYATPPTMPGDQVPAGATVVPPVEPGQVPIPGRDPIPGQKQLASPDTIPPTPPDLPGKQPTSGQAIDIGPDTPADAIRLKMQNLSNKDLLDHANMHPGEQSAGIAMDVLKGRLKDAGDDVKSAADVKAELDRQDVERANTERIKGQTKGFIPDYLKPHLDNDQNLKNAIFDEAKRRDQEGVKLGSRLTDIAKEFKILGDDGKLVDPRPEAPPQDVKGPVDVNEQKPTTGTTVLPDTPEDEPPTPPKVPDQPAAPPSVGKEGVPEQHQDKWQALDDIEKTLPTNLPAELADTPQKIADMKSKLASPKRGEVGQVVSFTNKLRDKLKALDVIREGQPEVPPGEPAPPEDLTKGAKKFDTPDEPPLPPENTTPPPTDRPFDNPPVHPEPAPTKARTARDIHAEHFIKSYKDVADQFGASPEAQRAASDFSFERGGRTLNKAVKKIGGTLDTDVQPEPGKELPQPKRPLNDRPSNEDVTTDPSAEPTVDPLRDVQASRPLTQRERDLAYLTHTGASARQLLQHIVRNGSTSVRRLMAARMLQLSKAEPSIRFGSRAEATAAHPTASHVYGDYTEPLGRIRVFDAADMEHTVLHEFMHAATIRALNSGGELARKADRLFNFAHTQLSAEERKRYGFTNVKEMFAEALSNPDFAHFLDGLDVPKSMQGTIPGATIWRALKEMVRRTFGFPKGAETMLDHVTHLAGRVMDETNRKWPAGSARDLNEVSGLYARSAQDMADKVLDYANKTADPMSWPTKLFKLVAGWRDLGGLADAMRNVVPAMGDKVRVTMARKILGDRVASLAVQAINMRRALPKDVQKLMSDIKQFTNLNIDPRRQWADQKWLHNDPDAAGLKAQATKAYNMYNELKMKGGDKAFDAEIQANRAFKAAYLSSELRNALIQGHAGGVVLPDDPFAKFAGDHTLRSSTRVAGDHFYQSMIDHLNVARDRIAAVKATAETETDPDKKKAMMKGITRIQSIERSIARNMTSDAQAPNFAIRRQGNYFVSGALHSQFTQAQVSRVQSYLADKGFHDVVFQHNADNNNFYMRVNSQSEATNLRQAMLDLQKEGTIDSKAIASGAASKITQNRGILPEWVQQNIQELKTRLPDLPEGTDADTAQRYEAARDSAIQQMVSQYLDMMPDSAASKMFARRQGVQGFNTDMNHAFEERAMASARGIANSASSVDMGNANANMLKQLRDVKTDSTKSIPEQVRAQVAVNEALMREAQHGFSSNANIVSSIRHITHVMELGFSVPYAMTLLTQLPTLGLPELAKTHGFASSSAAMIRAMPMAMRLMKAAATGDNKLGFVLTPEKLKAAGIPDDVAKFILHQDNRGDFNLSSYTSNIYDGLHHTNVGRVVHAITGASTLYSEMAPRLVVALAAKELFDKRPSLNAKNGITDLHTFASDKVNRSQFQWNTDLNPRNIGTQGVLGQAGPLMTQFMGYHLKLMEKVYREAADSVGARGEAEKAAGRRFMLGHVAAMVALSGTMGLPFTNAIAGLYDKLADAFTGDDTHDIKASYRNFLTTTFGKEFGEVMARGLPRMGGLDLSRYGEQDILPGTGFISDKRQWSDAEGDFFKGLAGSAAGLGSNFVIGGRDLMNGDVLEAGEKMLPEMLRNMAEAYDVGSRGYVDKSGFNLPIKAGTGDQVMKLLGFTPAKQAEYREESETQQGLEERSSYDQRNISSHLAKAYNLHDPEGFQKWLRASADYGHAHPGEMPPATEFAQFMQEHARSAAMAGALGTPLGVAPRDLLGRGATAFGNLGNQ